MAEAAVLEVSDVTAGYGELLTLRDVSLTVAAKSVTALLGPNGAGKTSLLNVVSGFLKPRSGSVALTGADITHRDPHQRVRAGLRHIPEGRGIFPSLNVRDNLRLHGRRGTEKDAIARAVDAFPFLADRMRQLAGTLSGGQQQMLALARAYDPEARVILVDEASLGLAPVIVDEIFEFLTRVDIALVLVEQYVTRALAMADTAYILSGGSVSYAGPASELNSERVFEYYLGMTPPA
ncbi:MAG: branched-chain amino acid transport system ATP-binding protein [Pseudonocardiales bacterium]|jgi:branched-chain amino acid transport system ATP-binding protein|nr:branched-chain amino acid transport system ATP-binding protein [Pseudonocardiales bacterium]